MRRDLAIIADLVRPGARVLDLGCGDGELLDYLQREKRVNGYGLEIDPAKISACIRRGVNVIEQDLDQGLQSFATDGFDLVVMTETLQAVREPALLIDEMLRIGEECIVTFPNFAHWRCRFVSGNPRPYAGCPPSAAQLVQHTQHSPLHVCRLRTSCARKKRLEIIERFVVDSSYQSAFMRGRMPNLFGAIAVYRLGRPR